MFQLPAGQAHHVGEGGIVVTNDDALARETRLFVNKSWPYGEADPDHRKLGLNYRITELQSAVLVAQVPHLADFVERRRQLAARLEAGISALPGLVLAEPLPGDGHAYWRYPLIVDRQILPNGVTDIAAALRAHGAAAMPRYIGKPAFLCGIFADQHTLGTSRWPYLGPAGGRRLQLRTLPWNVRLPRLRRRHRVEREIHHRGCRRPGGGHYRLRVWRARRAER